MLTDENSILCRYSGSVNYSRSIVTIYYNTNIPNRNNTINIVDFLDLNNSIYISNNFFNPLFPLQYLYLSVDLSVLLIPANFLTKIYLLTVFGFEILEIGTETDLIANISI